MSMPKLWSNFWGTMASTFRVGGPSGNPVAQLGPIPNLPADIYLDPVNGSDLNPGTSSNAALKTFAGVLGTIGDDYGSTVTIHVLSSQTPGSERIIFNPKLRGATTNLVIDGTSGIVWGNTFAAGTVTQFQWGATGHAMTLASLPGTPVVGQIIQNQTRGTYAIIRALSGSTATLTVPITSSGLVDSSWTTGDTIRVGTLPYLNLEVLRGVGGDANSSFTGGIVTTTHVRVPDVSGVPGDATLLVESAASEVMFTECVFDAFVLQALAGAGVYQACTMLGGANLNGARVTGGSCSVFFEVQSGFISGVFTTTGFVQFLGETGVLAMACEGTGNGQINIGDNSSLVLYGSVATQGYGSIWSSGGCHIQVGNGAIVRQALTSNPSPAWSPVFQFPDSQILFIAGTHGAHGGASFIPNTATWHVGIHPTLANLDAWGTIYDGGVSDADGTTSTPFSGAGFIGQYMPNTPPSWTQQDWYWDPAGTNGGDDNNSGAIGSPLRTWQAFLARMGTEKPRLPYGQSIIVHKLSAQSAGTDPVVWAPYLSGGGQTAIVDTLVVKSTSFTGGAVTARVRGAPGTRLAVAGFPGGTASGDYVLNVTRNSYASVDTGGATPTFGQPVPASTVTTIGIPTLAEDNTWTSGDTYIVYTRNLLNLKHFRPQGGDAASGGAVSGGWVQWSTIADSSGSGASEYPFGNDAGFNVMSGCNLLPRIHASLTAGRGFGAYLLGCDLQQPLVAFSGRLYVFAGVGQSGNFITTNPGALIEFDGDFVCHGTISNVGYCIVASAFGLFCDSTITTNSGGVFRADQVVYGSYGLRLFGGTFWANAGGTTPFTTIIKTTGAFTMQLATATAYIAATDTWHSQIPITVANMDAWGGLQDGNGSRFIGGAVPAPTVPPTWSQTTWKIDPQNSQGTSSDNNDGLTNGTALRTWGGAVSKLGTITPTLRTTAACTFLSSHTDNTDPVRFKPVLANGASWTFQGTAPTVVASGVVLAGTTAKNRTVGANSLLITTLGASATVNQLVQNTTAGKSSYAWPYKALGGNSFSMSQPFAPLAIPFVAFPTQVDTWANTDTVSLLQPVAVNIVEVDAVLADYSGAFNNQLFLTTLTIFDPLGPGSDNVLIGANVQMYLCSSQRVVCFTAAAVDQSRFCHNCNFQQTVDTAANGNAGSDPAFFGGIIQGPYANYINGGISFDGDVILGGANVHLIAGGAILSLCYLDVTITLQQGLMQILGGTYTAGPIIYGNGSFTIDARGSSHVKLGSGTFVQAFTAPGLVTGIFINGANTAQSHTGASPDVINSGITTTPAHLDAAAGVAGFGGTAFNLGGASVSKALSQ